MDECILKAERLTEKIESLTLIDDLNVAIKDRKSSASSGPAARMATSIKMTVGLLRPSGRRVQFDGVETQSKPKGRIGICPDRMILHEVRGGAKAWRVDGCWKIS